MAACEVATSYCCFLVKSVVVHLILIAVTRPKLLPAGSSRERQAAQKSSLMTMKALKALKKLPLALQLPSVFVAKCETACGAGGIVHAIYAASTSVPPQKNRL